MEALALPTFRSYSQIPFPDVAQASRTRVFDTFSFDGTGSPNAETPLKTQPHLQSTWSNNERTGLDVLLSDGAELSASLDATLVSQTRFH
ncbi:hypothetical protein O181_051712 [Austropuccinia psidii MF-1]|uniref:Uncharacterized protein n=1 Tax=Austropuccinia psidii MF-1 TaxID=1389203 RepID=A0A9Q3E674_9BASI|nr:hypothetical protein [Austropuccinia psidii MF-1]